MVITTNLHANMKYYCKHYKNLQINYVRIPAYASPFDGQREI